MNAVAACAGKSQFLKILARVWTTGLWRDGFVVARSIAFCATSAGDLDLAGALFRSSGSPTAYAFNAMIRGHSAGATPSEALLLFRRMLRNSIYPDKFTFPFVFRAIARMSPGNYSIGVAEQHHALLFKHGLSDDLHVQTSILHLYGSLRRIDAARQTFDEMPERGVVSWNVIISVYGTLSENPLNGVILFGRMVNDKLEVNDDTLVAVLQCCAAAGSFLEGKTVHAFMLRHRERPWTIETISSLLRTYVKCGSLNYAQKVFEEMPSRDLSAWTAMIGGAAEHGQGAAAVHLFKRMISQGLKPDALTFTSLLHSCSHSGMVEEGLELFRSMASAYNVEPRVQHYGAVVDLLVRAGMVEEARRLAASTPFELNHFVRSSLLQGMPAELLSVEENELSVEVSNAHARLERWDEVERVRAAMAEIGIRKTPAFSSVRP